MWLSSGSVIASGCMPQWGIEENSVPLWPEVKRPLDSRLGCWRNVFKRPVLKHGPRSLTCVRVFGWQTQARNESERSGSLIGAPTPGADLL